MLRSPRFALALVLLCTASASAQAGVLEELQKQSKSPLRQHAAGKAPDAGPRKSIASEPEEDGGEGKDAPEQADDPAAEEPVPSPESTAPAEQPESEATTNDPVPTLPEPAGGAQSDASESPEPARALPGPGELKVRLSSAVTEDEERKLINPGPVISCYATELHVEVTRAGDEPMFPFNARIFAEEVPGVAPGTETVSDVNSHRSELLSGNRHLGEIYCPDGTLKPGRYRVELSEAETPHRVFASSVFETRIPAAPKAEEFQLTLCDQLSADTGMPVEEKTQFPTTVPMLYLGVTSKEPRTLNCTARIVAVNVKGLRPGAVVQTSEKEIAQLVPERSRASLSLRLRAIGLPEGEYRAEVVEADRPYRAFASVAFSTRPQAAPGAFNVADFALGGLLESVTGEDGAGASWASRLLIPGNNQIWPTPNSDNPDEAAKPETLDLLISFFERQPALIAAVEVDSVAEGRLPAKLEVWGSPEKPDEGFSRLAEIAFEPGQSSGRAEFPATLARYVRIRTTNLQSNGEPAALTQIRVLEATAPGYEPLEKRFPAIATWRLQPRKAAQHGLYFLQPTSVAWQRKESCLGCHVQGQALMGIGIARQNEYVVSGAAERILSGFSLEQQKEEGDFGGITTSIFSALGVRHARRSPADDERLEKAARWLAKLQLEEGSVTGDDSRAPIEQGDCMFTANCLSIWSEVLARKDIPELRAATQRALAFLEKADVFTTQDKVFRILGLAQHGNAAQQKKAREFCALLQTEQQPDGSWLIDPEDARGSSAFATGEVLYAMRVAGVSPNAATFRRGVQYLVVTQEPDGSWNDPHLESYFAGTMWPVIALTGAFANRAEPAHILVSALPRPVKKEAHPSPLPPPPPAAKAELPKNVVLVMDCSLSMDDRLGKSTRMKVAKQVMKDLIARLPEDLNVGLRLYGHRHSSISDASRRDTQLVVPIRKLDRAALIRVIDQAEPRGQTPLVYSTLEAGRDLKNVGGGSIVVITDGEESCGGKPRKAGAELVALGVPVRLDVIGFTLTKKRVAEDMVQFTAPTGGRYYAAQDGPQLASALAAATSPAPRTTPPPAAPPPPLIEMRVEDFRYDIVNLAGEKSVSSSTLAGEAPDLEPGTYRVILHDGAKKVELGPVTVEASDSLELIYSPETGELTRATGA